MDKEEEIEPPYIGKVLDMTEDEVSIHWMRGGYYRQWKEWCNGCPYSDIIPKQSILLK